MNKTLNLTAFEAAAPFAKLWRPYIIRKALARSNGNGAALARWLRGPFLSGYEVGGFHKMFRSDPWYRENK